MSALQTRYITTVYQVIKFVIAASLQSKSVGRGKKKRSQTFACSPLLVRLSGPALLCSGRRGGESAEVKSVGMSWIKKQSGNSKERKKKNGGGKKKGQWTMFNLCLFKVLQRWNTRTCWVQRDALARTPRTLWDARMYWGEENCYFLFYQAFPEGWEVKHELIKFNNNCRLCVDPTAVY